MIKLPVFEIAYAWVEKNHSRSFEVIPCILKKSYFFSTATFYKNLNLFCIWVAARGSQIETSMIDRS